MGLLGLIHLRSVPLFCLFVLSVAQPSTLGGYIVRTVAGVPGVAADSPAQGNGRPATLSPLYAPFGVAADGQGGFFVSEASNYNGHVVYHVSLSGESRLFAGIPDAYPVVTNSSALINVTYSGDGGPAT